VSNALRKKLQRVSGCTDLVQATDKIERYLRDSNGGTELKELLSASSALAALRAIYPDYEAEFQGQVRRLAKLSEKLGGYLEKVELKLVEDLYNVREILRLYKAKDAELRAAILELCRAGTLDHLPRDSPDFQFRAAVRHHNILVPPARSCAEGVDLWKALEAASALDMVARLSPSALNSAVNKKAFPEGLIGEIRNLCRTKHSSTVTVRPAGVVRLDARPTDVDADHADDAYEQQQARLEQARELDALAAEWAEYAGDILDADDSGWLYSDDDDEE
jgi:hypothetical protein